MAHLPVSNAEFIGHFEDLVETYRKRINDLKRIASVSHGNARTYRLVKQGQAEELEQCVIEIMEIITWYRKKIGNIGIKERRKQDQPGQIPLFSLNS
jgi:hypothetical protein